MKHVLCFLLLSSRVLAQAPMPPDPQPVVQASLAAPDVAGTGKRNDPYLFTTSSKCAIRLTGAAVQNAVWDTSDAPTDFEVLGQVAIFSLSEPGTYVVYVRGENWHTKAWFTIQAGQTPPPVDDISNISKRVKSALAGPDAKTDAAKFGAVCSELAKALDAGTITRLSGMETSLKAALDAVGWSQGKYPALSKLAGELFGEKVPDKPLDTELKSKFAKQLRQIAQACEEVSH